MMKNTFINGDLFWLDFSSETISQSGVASSFGVKL